MRYGLIGKNVKNSYSPFIHNKLGGYDYAVKNLSEEELARFFTEKDFCAINVTAPYKRICTKYIDVLSEYALSTGTVNTVINKNGVLYGYNTDVYGLSELIKSADIKLKNKTVLILGGGGTGNTAKFLCKIKKAKKIYVATRSGEINYSDIYDKCVDTEVIINCTPVGSILIPNAKLVDIEKFKKLKGVIDVVYNPFNTPLVLSAKERGIKAVGGLKMLVYQAKKTVELIKGEEISENIAENVYNEILKVNSNIILTGFSGSGKTVIGETLSKMLDKKFYDTDDIVKSVSGFLPEDIIVKNSEKDFRALERQAVKSLYPVTGAVIALGGGTVLDRENVNLLKQNGIIINIVRKLEDCATENRPIVEKVGVKELYKERKNIYDSVSDFTVKNDGTVEDVSNKIIKVLNENFSY